MRKYLFQLLFGFSILSVSAQETTPQDAIRLAVDNLTGTARFRALSGAFGAVGGDLSSINVNPAGSIFFNNNFGTVTGTIFSTKNSANYFGTRRSDNDSSLDINQIGAVFVFENNNKDDDWKKFSLAINYDNTNNFNNSIFSAGTNPYNSIGRYFENFAQGVPLGVLTNNNFHQLNFSQQQAFLGYNTYIFDPFENVPSNSAYYTNIPLGGNYRHVYQMISTGYNGKLTGNFSTSYKDRVMLGLNLNAHFLNFERSSSVYESNNNPVYSTGSTISEIYFENILAITGSGFSFNLGTIIKPTDNIRFGISYESPTWYRLTDELAQGVSTHSLNNPDNREFPNSYHPSTIFLPYTVKTPEKWTGSATYIFGKKGLLSADISTKNYSETRFIPRNDIVFSNLNNYLNNALHDAVELRLGGEYKIKRLSLRGGYRFEQSPYKNDRILGDLTGFSTGLGYNFGESRLDLAYSYDQRKMNQAFLSSGMTDPARISRYNNNVVISYSLNF